MGRVFSTELAALRRSPLVWLTVLLCVGGSILARTIAWISFALERSEIGELIVFGSTDPIHIALPAALLAYLLATTYLFGRDFDDGCADLVLTAPVRREAVVLGRLSVLAVWVLVLALLAWWGDYATRALLGATSLNPGATVGAGAALGSALAAIATLPLVAWAAIRLRGMLPALAVGIGIEVVGVILGSLAPLRAMPWFLPVTFAAGESASWLAVAGAVALFAAGVATAILALRRVDIFE